MTHHVEHLPSPGKPRLLVSAPYEFMPQIKWEMQKHFDVTLAYNAAYDRVKDLVSEPVAWITDTCPPYLVDRELLDQALNLRVLATPSTGTNHIDVACLQSRQISLISLKDSPVIEDIHASSEFSFALLLALIKKIPASAASANVGVWREREDEFRSVEVHGKTIGLVGYGRIGRKMARFAGAFGMRVLVYDPYVEAAQDPEVEQVALDTLLAASDIVSIHVHLNEQTRHMVDASFFGKMKPGAYFLNTARGDIVDEDALIACLESGHIRAAAVDVIRGEHIHNKRALPLIQYAREHDHLIVTPHIAGATLESQYKAGRYILDQVVQTLGRLAADKVDRVH
jgi:phosphoglycerate dehydrogenase-like enzyme